VAVPGAAGELHRVLTRAQQLHDGERHVGEPRRVGLAPPREELLQRGGARLRGQPLTEDGRQRDDAVPPLGGAQDPPHRGEAVAFEDLRGRDVRRDHEVLDELFGRVLLVRPQVG
jgi:hypothetical protein